MASSIKHRATARREDDIQIRLEKLKQEVAALSKGMRVHVSADCPPEIEEQLWKRVIAFEHATEVQPFEVLVLSGVSLPPPEDLDDVELTVKLWEVIRRLAFLGMYLFFTDHLSDRQLYARLWTDVLREPAELQPDDPDVACDVDLTEPGSEEGILLYLRYYADEDGRRRWAEEWPDHPMPDAEQLPFDRDRDLPRPCFG
jgi:hypothetical protein